MPVRAWPFACLSACLLTGVALGACGGPDAQLCECAAVEGWGPPSCGMELCAEVILNQGDDGLGNPGPATLETPEALDCALEALAARTHGYILWAKNPGGQYKDGGSIYITEDERVIVHTWGAGDLIAYTNDAVLGEAQAREFYEGCLEESDDAVRFECLRAPLLGEERVCVEGTS